MAAEIGLILLIIASVISLLLAITPFIAVRKNSSYLKSYTSLFVHLNTTALLAAIITLGVLFVGNDFSVAYVANNSNTQLATLYKIAAVWGGHEGSMLFWIVAIAIWNSCITLNTRKSDNFHQYLCAILAMLILGFLLFLLFTSNPFARLLPEIPVEGRDLNPILQDIGLILHPPALFIGYVGLSVCFAGAMAALLDSRDKIQQHCKQLRPWAIIAWIALTGGNAFGSWWAYNELGWGGWWFWDPVENASFIPWLVATAMVHALILSEKRNAFHASSLFICLLGFALCLLGTFLVRSGVVQSVHAFAADPTRGTSILILLMVFVGCGLALFAYRAPGLISSAKVTLGDKTVALQLGNFLLLATALSILLGTCYPLLYEVLTGATISVGAPYFNSIFIPLLLLIVLLMGAAPLLSWHTSSHKAIKKLAIYALGVLAVAIVTTIGLYQQLDLYLISGVFCIIWLPLCLIKSVTERQKRRAKSAHHDQTRFVGMFIAHMGVALSIFGVTTVSYLEQEELLRMGPGQGKALAGYTFIYEATETVEYPSYSALQAKIAVKDSRDRLITYIYPQRQTFNTNAMEISAAGIHRSLFGDIYISMGTQLSEQEYLVRISYKPMVSWIWIGALLMMFAGLMVLWQRRLVVHSGKHWQPYSFISATRGQS
ncbi:heme lyase CcmF/NrfE family subunit [Shewanella colwelliana]|uniref:heme lyase CcmF/NrfE family subunit n=1 Tax=Shewanella colwelliana TaxID=23 RepID=UPI0037359DF3